MNLEEAKAALEAGHRIKDKDGDIWATCIDPEGIRAIVWKGRSGWNFEQPWPQLEPFSLIDPEPEKEGLSAEDHHRVTQFMLARKERKTSGLTREEAYEAAKAGALVKAMKPEVPHLIYRAGGHELEFFEESFGWIGAKHDCFTATYPEAPKPEFLSNESLVKGLEEVGKVQDYVRDEISKMSGMTPKPEPIELGEKLLQFNHDLANGKHDNVATGLVWNEHDHLLISRILEIVGERR